MARKSYTLYTFVGVIVVAILYIMMGNTSMNTTGCPGSQVYCPGVGCVSGPDKCFSGASGGPSKVFSKETFVSKSCPGNYRSDGPCLMEF